MMQTIRTPAYDLLEGMLVDVEQLPDELWQDHLDQLADADEIETLEALAGEQYAVVIATVRDLDVVKVDFRLADGTIERRTRLEIPEDALVTIVWRPR